MSFGFGAVDFIAVLEKANELHDRFADAPAQFKAISREVSNLASVLRDIETLLPKHDLAEWQVKQLMPVLEECYNVVASLANVVNQNYCLESSIADGIRGKARRTWKRLTWEPKDIQELRVRMTLNVAYLGVFTQSLTSKVTVETQSSVERLHERQDNRERDEEHTLIHNWLTAVDYDSQHSDYIRERGPKTGEWLLRSPMFRTWLGADKQTLFCPGIPGAGKTILTAIVVEHVIGQFCHDPDIGIAYIYCNFRRKDDQKLNDLLASLLQQLSKTKQSTPRVVADLYKQHKPRQTRPLTEELSKAFQSVAASYSKVFIIVDAVDECQTDNRCRDKFLSEMFGFQEKCNANLFMTSRFIPDVTSKFNGKPCLEIRAAEEDIERYLDSRMETLSSFDDWEQKLQDEVKKEISQAVDGMFLLARLYLDTLDDKTSAWEVRKTLRQFRARRLGSTEAEQQEILHGAYDEAMKRITAQKAGFRQLAEKVLSWIVCAQQPLTTSEIQTALAVEAGDLELNEEKMKPINRMVSVCAGLVTADEESGIIRLVHYTTQEYFQRTQARWLPAAEADVTTICATYLSFGVFASGPSPTDDAFEERLHLSRLYDYAARNWGHHARKALDSSQHDCRSGSVELGVKTEEAKQAVVDFLERRGNFEAGVQALFATKGRPSHFEYSQQFPRATTLHLAAYFGLGLTLHALLDAAGVDPDARDSNGRTPLSWAAENGHEAVMKLLLAVSSVSPGAKDNEGRTPLSWATENGHESVVKLLSMASVDPDAKDNRGRTPLSYAAENGHDAVVKLLLSTTSIDPDAKDNKGRAPLSWAAESGREAAVRLLLATGNVDPSGKDNECGRTPLSWAARSGHEAVVKLLLATASIDPDAKDCWGWTPLSLAARNGHEAVVELLLATAGVDPDAKDDGGRTPLSWAAGDGREAAVNFLLASTSVDPDAKDNAGRTPLSWAAENGHEAVVQLLLVGGIEDPDAKDNGGRTPLNWATKAGHEAVVKVLLSTTNVDADAKDDEFGRTPLSLAAERGRVAIVKLLLATASVDPNTKDRWGRTPLSWAAEKGREAVVKLLLATSRADPDAKDNEARTPLSWAARSSHEAVVKVLLDTTSVDPDAKDNKGRTPLSWAAESGHEAVLNLLATASVDLHAKDKTGRTPLIWATEKGREVVVKLLATDGVDPDAKDIKGRTPLS